MNASDRAWLVPSAARRRTNASTSSFFLPTLRERLPGIVTVKTESLGHPSRGAHREQLALGDFPCFARVGSARTNPWKLLIPLIRQVSPVEQEAKRGPTATVSPNPITDNLRRDCAHPHEPNVAADAIRRLATQ